MTTRTEEKYDKNHWLNIWLSDPDMKVRLKVRAAEQDLSISAYVRLILERELDEG